MMTPPNILRPGYIDTQFEDGPFGIRFLRLFIHYPPDGKPEVYAREWRNLPRRWVKLYRGEMLQDYGGPPVSD